MLKDVLKPLYLIPEYHVEVKWALTGNSHAFVEPIGDGKNNKFRITINKSLAMNLFSKSLLFGKIPFNDFLLGLMYHEVSHILYKSFSIEINPPTELMHYILNILLDSQIEYHLSKDYPEAAIYLRYSLLCLRRDADMKMLTKYEGGEKIIQLKDTLYYLTRFGVVLKNSDTEFVNFVLPFLLSSQRNDVQNVSIAAPIIYEFLFASAETKELQKEMESVKETISSLNEGDIQKIEEAGENEIVAVSLKKTLEDIESESKNKGIGNTGPDIQIVEQDDPYYRTVVNKHREKIIHIRDAFKRVLNEIIDVPAFDGELDVRNQQQAYVDSFTGDENELYYVPQLNSRSIDILVIRDVSGSTSFFMNEYAEGSVILHAAIQDFPNIRDAHIDFSTNSIVLLNFDQSIRTARIHPRSETSTRIAPAYEDALKMNWKSSKRVIVVITDGGISGEYQYLEKQLISKRIKIKKYHIGTGAREGIQETTIDRFHYDIANFLLKEI